jgi:hypothetical protein
MTAKKAAPKKAAVKKPKDSWCYFMNGDDETYQLFPSYEAAYKDVVKRLKEDRYDDYGTSSGKPIKVQFFQLAAESQFEFKFEVKETPVMKREIVFKGEAK